MGKKIELRYFSIAEDDDPQDKPVGVLRERDIAGTRWVHTEVYSGIGVHSRVGDHLDESGDSPA